MNELKWQLIQECTSLWAHFDPLFDPRNPRTLSLPKLKTLVAIQKDEAQTVRHYDLPALEELKRPSVQFLRLLPNKNSIKKLEFDKPTPELIQIIGEFTQLESLAFDFCENSKEVLQNTANLKNFEYWARALVVEELVHTVLQFKTLKT